MSEEKYTIGIIASPRQTGVQFKPKLETGRGKGTSVFRRGTYQFTGHTAIYVRHGTEVILARGLVPNKSQLAGAILKNQTVKGHWQDDRALFDDPTSATFELQIDKDLADSFVKYFSEVIEPKLTHYTLKPNNITDTNCVHGAIVGFFNFVSENFDKFSDQKQLATQLNTLLEFTSSNKQTRQGHLMKTIHALNKQKNPQRELSMLHQDLVSFMQKETQRVVKLGTRNPRVLQKYEMAKHVMKMLESKSSPSNMDEAKKMISEVERYAGYKKNPKNPKTPTSSTNFERVKMFHRAAISSRMAHQRAEFTQARKTQK